MNIYNSIVSWIIKKRIHHIELFINYPHEVQNELRQHLIDSAKNTEFGKTYDFKSIKNSKILLSFLLELTCTYWASGHLGNRHEELELLCSFHPAVFSILRRWQLATGQHLGLSETCHT